MNSGFCETQVSGGGCNIASACVEAVKVAGGDIGSTCLSGMGASCTDWEGHKALFATSCYLVYDGAGCYGYILACILPSPDKVHACARDHIDR